MSEKTILVWFRNDLRIHDNEILCEALRKADKVLPVYVFDPYYFTTNAAGSLKTSSFRTRFLIESVADLRLNLRKLGGELLIRVGDPAVVLTDLAAQYHVSEVYHHREVAPEETATSERVETALWKMKLNLKHFIGHTMYHKEDLPFPIKDIPDSFVTFKKKVERDSSIRPVVTAPQQVPAPQIDEPGELPSLTDLNIPEQVNDPRAAHQYIGGETAALKQLDLFITRQQNGLQTRSASGLSPWLAVGCISPRQVYWEVVTRQRAHEIPAGDQLMLELLWRDHFRFMFKKHGSKFFRTAGEGSEASAKDDELFDKWKNGRTGNAEVDAAMHELNATGYTSNYNRQLLAHYLVDELKADWVKGALYFEEKLIDYSPASNWGNWAFIAGVGSDPKSLRLFNASKPGGQQDNISYWLPDTPANIPV